MSFRCLFILRSTEIDINETQNFCYKSFSNFNKPNQSHHFIPLSNFNDWYNSVISTLHNKNYFQFNESSINDYLSNPIFKITTSNGDLWPCILLTLGNFIFGGLIYSDSEDKHEINDRCGRAVDFICSMSQYFMEIIKKDLKLKMVDLLPDFYYFIRVICPYGTPVTSSMNLVEFIRSPESIMKTINVSTNEKIILSVNQIPSNMPSKGKEIRITIEEIVTGVMHETRNKDIRHDIEIVGEVNVSVLNLNVNTEISMTLRPSQNQNLFNNAVMVDLLLHPSCAFCDFKSPVNISMLNRKEFPKKTLEDSSSSPSYSINENSLVSKHLDLDNTLLTRHLQPLNRVVSINTELEYSKSSSISVRVKPWAESCTLLSYRFMKYPKDNVKQDCNVPFVNSLRSPDPPIFGSYQFEDFSSSPDAIGNLVLRLNLNTDMLPVPEKNKSIEFSRLEVIIPFPNRPALLDVSKCIASQGKVTILEQNNHIMVWSLGTTFKNKKDASLMGSIKFSSELSTNQFVDQFCVGSNAYAQINFILKSSNISSLAVDQKTFKYSGDRGIKFIQHQDSKSFNFKIWNCMGDCPMELQS